MHKFDILILLNYNVIGGVAMYCAVIADIINSKTTRDRGQVQKKLNKILAGINKDYDGSIASNFTITLGDEFQGLLNNPKSVMEIINHIKMSLYPVDIRVGIGFGEMTTEINPEMAIGADGPAYYKAREAVNWIKDAGSKYEQIKQNICFVWELSSEEKTGPSNPLTEYINVSLAGLNFIESKWSDKEREVINFVEVDNAVQKDIALNIGVTQSTVSRRLQNSGYLLYKKTLKTVNDMMNDLWRESKDE